MHTDDEITARTAKVSVAFGRVRKNVWERNGISLDTKLKVYKAVILATLLYACETWTVYQRHAKRPFPLEVPEETPEIRWQDKIPDTEFLDKAKMQSVLTLLKLVQLRWTRHVTRMPDKRLPKKFSMENVRMESAHKVAKRKATKTRLNIYMEGSGSATIK